MIRTMRLGLAAIIFQLLACGAVTEDKSLAPAGRTSSGPGPAEVQRHPDPRSLLRDRDPALEHNKRLVFDMWRSIVNAGHIELADAMLQEGYIQHSPILPTGREAFKKIFSVVKRREIPDVVSPPLVTILAEGNLVIMALREELPEPSGSGRYTTTHFNMFRIEDGRLAEHWHSIQDAPGPDVLFPEQGGPQRVTGILGKAQLSVVRGADAALTRNKRLVFDAWRQMDAPTQAKAPGQHFAEDYIEHDPNLGFGRSALHGQTESGLPPPSETPIVALVAQGDLVVLVTSREHLRPGQSDATYTTTWFDMFRIANGRIAEHWDGASKPGTPAQDYGN